MGCPWLPCETQTTLKGEHTCEASQNSQPGRSNEAAQAAGTSHVIPSFLSFVRRIAGLLARGDVGYSPFARIVPFAADIQAIAAVTA